MNRFKFYICERDLIEIARGNMDKVTWHARKPKQCPDSYCNFDSILEVYLTIVDPSKDAKKSNMDKAKNNIRKSLPRTNRR